MCDSHKLCSTRKEHLGSEFRLSIITPFASDTMVRPVEIVALMLCNGELLEDPCMCCCETGDSLYIFHYGLPRRLRPACRV